MSISLPVYVVQSLGECLYQCQHAAYKMCQIKAKAWVSIHENYPHIMQCDQENYSDYSKVWSIITHLYNNTVNNIKDWEIFIHCSV